MDANLRYAAFTMLLSAYLYALAFVYEFDPSILISAGFESVAGVASIFFFIFFIEFFETIKNIGTKIEFPQLLFASFFILLNIFLFAKIYEISGIYSTTLENYEPTKFDHLYFSFVTWTTLGFGDFAPTDNSKVVVVFEVMIGFILNTLLLGAILSSLFQKKLDLEKDGGSK